MIFQGAKWLKIQALLDQDELKDLFLHLGNMFIFPLGIPLLKSSFPVTIDQYLLHYTSWIEDLKQGCIPKSPSLKELNMTLWCENENGVQIQELSNSRFLIRPTQAHLQVQIHSMGYSSVDQTFRPMVLGQETIFWGLQWSYPQVGQDAKTGEIFEMKPHPWFVKLRSWCRDRTLATPIQIDGMKMNLPMRIGKNCFSWINKHPQLIKIGANCGS